MAAVQASGEARERLGHPGGPFLKLEFEVL